MLSGNPITEVREGNRTVSVVARAQGNQRENLGNLNNMTLTNSAGTSVPLAQVGHFQAVMEEPILKRRDRATTVEVRADIIDGVQPPDVEMAVYKDLQPLIARLPAGYQIDIGGPVEESAKANVALAALFPIMILLTLTVIMFQVRSFGVMFMVFATAPLGLIGAVPTLLLFNQPFGFNAILGLIGIGGILMLQHADLYRPDPPEPGPRHADSRGHHRSHGTARTAGDPDRAGGRVGVHSADVVGVLVVPRVCADRRRAGGHRVDAVVPAGTVQPGTGA